MSKTLGVLADTAPTVISYPNNIKDHLTVQKLREMIDHTNALKSSHAQNLAQTQANTAAIKALPASFLTSGDVNSQISIQLGTDGSIYKKIIDILASVNIHPPAPQTALLDGSREDGNG